MFSLYTPMHALTHSLIAKFGLLAMYCGSKNSSCHNTHTHTHTHTYTHRALLPKVQPAMFERWVHMFGREVIVLSSRHPLVSGFYKLLAACFKICKKIAYFKVWYRAVF